MQIKRELADNIFPSVCKKVLEITAGTTAGYPDYLGMVLAVVRGHAQVPVQRGSWVLLRSWAQQNGWRNMVGSAEVPGRQSCMEERNSPEKRPQSQARCGKAEQSNRSKEKTIYLLPSSRLLE